MNEDLMLTAAFMEWSFSENKVAMFMYFKFVELNIAFKIYP